MSFLDAQSPRRIPPSARRTAQPCRRNHGLPGFRGPPRRAVHRLVRERIEGAHLIKRSPRRPPEDRLMTLVAGIAIADPELTLREIAAQLEKMRERPPRGGRQWAASSVKSLLDQARRLGLAVHDPAPGS